MPTGGGEGGLGVHVLPGESRPSEDGGREAAEGGTEGTGGQGGWEAWGGGDGEAPTETVFVFPHLQRAAAPRTATGGRVERADGRQGDAC